MGGGEARDRYVIGVDLGGTNLKTALVARDGCVVTRRVVPTEAHEGHQAVLHRIAAEVRQVRESAPPQGEVAAIGIGVPGEVRMATGYTRDLPNLPDHWVDVPVAPFLTEQTGLPAFLINDVRAFTVAEAHLGAAKGAETALCLAVGTGIGGGVVTHGRVHFGLGGAAGEIGHVIVLAEGPRCGCGNQGCVEALASGPAIAAEAVRRILQGFTTAMTAMAGDDLDRVTPKLVAEAAEAGDAVAIEVLGRAGWFLGLAVAGAIALLAPEVVVVGGGVAHPGSVYWRAFEETARSHSHVTEIERIAFRPAALGYDAGVIGAAMWGALQIEGGAQMARS